MGSIPAKGTKGGKIKNMTSMENKSDRELLEEMYLLSKEDHKIVKSLQSRIRIQNVVNILKWVVYIGVAVGLYSYLQPFLNGIMDTYGALQDSTAAIGELKDKLPNLSSFSF